jgi:glycosyltransferase involved in cell wall biosynthesis
VRIAFAINDLSGGGAEKVLQLLASFLVTQGHTVKVVTLQSGNDAYQLDSRIERITLKTGWFNRGIGRVAALPIQARELQSFLEKWQPDVCVSFLPRSNIAHVMTRWFGNRRPILLTEQASSRDTYPSSGYGDRFMRALLRRFYPQADAVFTSSEGVKEGLLEFGVAPDKMHVVYNPISLRDIEESSQVLLPPANGKNAPTVITVGRHAEQKDHETLLRSFARVRSRVEARLVLVGQGPLRGSLEALARDLHIEDSVIFAGWKSNPFAWMARADLFVLSSRFEGFGNVIVEAMACGLPVISTDCPSGPREILRDGADGVLVPVGNVDALAHAMTTILTDNTLRTQMTEKAIRRAPDFDIFVIGPQYEVLLREYVRDEGHVSA